MSTYTGMTTEQILARLEVEQLAAEEEQTFKGHKVSELREVFQKVQNGDNWKAPGQQSYPIRLSGW
jgi:hypothetical protein